MKRRSVVGFTDNITVKIESDGAPGKKNVLVQMYSGDRAREPQRITDMDGNPMLVVYLDGAVSHFRQLAGGDAAYLKGMFKKYLGDGATIAPVTITYKGQQVDGYPRDGDTLCERSVAREDEWLRGRDVHDFAFRQNTGLLCADGLRVHEYRQEEPDT